MKLFYIAMLLTVMQTSPPIPRQATNNAAGSSQNIQQYTAAKQVPSSSAIVKNPSAAPEEQNSTNKPTDTNAQEAIVIREPVPVSVGKDWWDRAYIVFTGLLVLIGGIGVLAAFRTLKIIERQTRSIHHQAIQVRKQTYIFKKSAKAAQKAAEAAKTSADALIASERAWIMVDILPPPGWGEKVRGIVGDHIINGIHTQTTSVALRIVSRNEGKAPAWIIEKRVCVEIRNASLPPIPDLDSIQTREYEPQPVAVGKEAIPPWDITPSCDGHEGMGQTTVIYGVIVYRDPFSEGHTTTFGYWVAPDGQLRRLEGLLKYNENT